MDFSHRFAWVLIVLVIALTPAGAQDAVSKTGTAQSTDSTTEVVGGDTVRWVIDYDNVSGGVLEGVQIDDPIGANQSFVPGSLEVPPGWQALFSTNGINFSTTEPLTGVTDLRATADLVPPGTGVAAALPRPFEPTLTGSGGDGTNPILFGDRIFTHFHHQPADRNQINCIERSTGQVCAGYPYTFESTPGPGRAGGQGFGDISTTFWPEQDQNDGLSIKGTRLFYGAQRALDWGVGCWDLATAENCGYLELAADRIFPNLNPAVFEGPHRIGDRLYFADFRNQVFCFDLATETACPGFPVDVADVGDGMPDVDVSKHSVVMALEVIGDRLYFIQNYVGVQTAIGVLGAVLTCFDSTTNTRCAGWTSELVPGSDIGISPASAGTYARKTPAGTADAVCVQGNQSANPENPGAYFHQCYDLNTAAQVPVPAKLDAVLKPGASGSTLFLEMEDGIRTYFPHRFFDNDQDFPGTSVWKGETICYDWSLRDVCPNFDLVDGQNDGLRRWVVDVGVTQDYGYASDGTCLFGLGNQGVLWSFDPESGSTPCLTTDLTLTAPDFFCDGEGHPFTWDRIELSDIDLTPGVDFSIFDVKVFDNLGTLRLGPIKMVGTSGVLDLSGIPVGPNTETLTVEIQATALSTAPWDDGDPPLVVTTFDADASAQFCFETQIPDVCDTIEGPIENTVTTALGASATASLAFVENIDTCGEPCPVCEEDSTGATVTVIVDEDVTVDFNPFSESGAAPTCDDGVTPDLCSFFAFDVSGPTPDTWKAVFDLGGKKLIVGDNATVAMVNVPPDTNSQDAPGFEFLTTCEIEVSGDLDGNGEPGAIVIDGLNGDTGDIVIEADGKVTIDGHVRNRNGGTRGAVGDIRIGSCCGGVMTGPRSRVETENHIDAGQIDIVACCSDETTSTNIPTGDILIGGLVRSIVAIPPVPVINVIAFEGSVTIDGTSDLGQESVAGALVRRTSGLLARTLNRATSGRINIQARDDVTVIGRELLSSRRQNGAVAVRSREGGELMPDAKILVISLEGKIVAVDRAFDVGHRFAGDNEITLHALGDIDLSVSNAIDFGASDRRKPVLDARGGKGTSAAGGTNTLRSFQGDVLVGADVQLLADAVGGTSNSGGTNVLDARGAPAGTVTVAAGTEVLATAGGSDGSNEILACVSPAIDSAATVDPFEVVTLECLASQAPQPLADPTSGEPLTCSDFGFEFLP